jgi:membrane-associated PAP2 superfamily phosphatase
MTASASAFSPHLQSVRQLLVWTLVGTVLLLAWDLSGLDMWLARLAGTATGFPLQENWFWKGVMHERARQLHWLPELALVAAVFFPFGPMRTLPTWRRVQLAVGTLLGVLLVSSLKLHSHTSCPWDLQEFGGIARYVSHWSLARDGGSGSCFPAGHASAGFAYVTGYFVFRTCSPGLARRWLVVCLIAGLALGAAQQLRGAHFMSHTLWTAWLCWMSAFLTDAVFTRLALRRQASRTPSHAPEPAPVPAAPEPWLPPA